MRAHPHHDHPIRAAAADDHQGGCCRRPAPRPRAPRPPRCPGRCRRRLAASPERCPDIGAPRPGYGSTPGSQGASHRPRAGPVLAQDAFSGIATTAWQPLIAGPSGKWTGQLNTSALPPGPHRLQTRVQGADGGWWDDVGAVTLPRAAASHRPGSSICSGQQIRSLELRRPRIPGSKILHDLTVEVGGSRLD